LNTEIIAEIIRTELTNSDIKKIDDCFIFDATEKIEINKGIVIIHKNKLLYAQARKMLF
jgi:hypothetical protein